MAKMTREARRAQIAQGAMCAVAEHGYERATIQKIASAAGITSGLIHYHFPSKQAILLELIALLTSRHLARYERALIEHDGDPLDAFIESQLGTSQGSDPVALASWVAISAEAVHQPEVREVFAEAMRTQHDLLCEMLRTRYLCPEPQAKELASAILSMIQGIFLLSQASPELLPEGFAARQLRAAVRGMLILATSH